jgi:AraC-like DNA-binding protein
MAAHATSTTAPDRVEFSTTDAAVAMDYYPQAYRTPMRFQRVRDGVVYGHSRLEAGLFAIDEVRLPLDLRVALDPLNALVVVDMQAGTVGRECLGVDEGFGAGDICIAADPGARSSMRFLDSRFRTTMLDLSVLAQVASNSPARSVGPIRFTGFRPISDRAAENWKSTCVHVGELLANTEAIAQPLIRGNGARLLAATALTTFPNTAVVEPTAQDRRDATHTSLRRAVAFLEAHPDRDISAADIAAAAHVSIRALQIAFRRHLDTTPMGYLRDVRLDRVHRELLEADPTGDATVTDIATRWGFHNHSRFAARYKRAYGVAPRDTLRRA